MNNECCICGGECDCKCHTEEQCIQDLVIEDIKKRKELGKKKYGKLLYPHNGRNALLDAYEEALDLCQYLKQALLENASQKVDETCYWHKDYLEWRKTQP